MYSENPRRPYASATIAVYSESSCASGVNHGGAPTPSSGETGMREVPAT